MESEELDLENVESMELRNISEERPFRDEPLRSPAAIAMPGAQRKQEIVVFQPGTFNEAQQVAEHIKARKVVVINMKRADKDLAKRIIDFLSGINYAVDGHVQKIADNIFLFAPVHVQVTMVDEIDVASSEEPLFYLQGLRLNFKLKILYSGNQTTCFFILTQE
jgi:cell division inhibitor SepF